MSSDDGASIMLRYEDGTRGLVAVSQVAAGTEEHHVDRGRRSRVRPGLDVRGSGSALDRPSRAGPTRSSSAIRRLLDRVGPRPSSDTRADTSRATPTHSGPFSRGVPAYRCGVGCRTAELSTFADGHDAVCVTEAVAVEPPAPILGEGREVEEERK